MDIEEILKNIKEEDLKGYSDPIGEQGESGIPKQNMLITFLPLFLPLLISIILWITISIKGGLLFYGLFTLGMYIHLTLTTLSNAFIGREIDAKGDTFWKIVLLTLSCITLTIFFTI